LKDAIKELVWSGEIKAEMLQVMINSRHQDALARARAATQRTLDVLRAGETLELAAGELRIAVNASAKSSANHDGRPARLHLQPVLHREMIAKRQLHCLPILSMPLRFKSSGVMAMRNSTSA